MFSLYGFLFAFPIDTEGRITYTKFEGEILELVIGEGIAEAHIIGIAAANHHISLSNGES